MHDLSLPRKSRSKKYSPSSPSTRTNSRKTKKDLELENIFMKNEIETLTHIKSQLENSNKELQCAYLDTIHRLVMVSELKDEDTGDHIVRIGHYSKLMAEKIGLPSKEVQIIFYSAPMHDIGKVGIPDRILLKPDKLSPEEFELMKSHTSLGARIMSGSSSPILQSAREIALTHHEKWNGMGYPRKLKGEEIPLIGRIVGLVDVFDALTSRRPYKEPYPVDVALTIIKKERGEHFDPLLVDIFLENIESILEIRQTISPRKHLTSGDFACSERDRLLLGL